jgi:hypothetical protein
MSEDKDKGGIRRTDDQRREAWRDRNISERGGDNKNYKPNKSPEGKESDLVLPPELEKNRSEELIRLGKGETTEEEYWDRYKRSLESKEKPEEEGKISESILAIAQRRGRLKQKSLPLKFDEDNPPGDKEEINQTGKNVMNQSKKKQITPLDHYEAKEWADDAVETELAKNVGKEVPPEVAAKPEED